MSIKDFKYLSLLVLALKIQIAWLTKSSITSSSWRVIIEWDDD